MEIAKTLFKEYIGQSLYVFYKEHDAIIIMQIFDKFKCVYGAIEPKKYSGLLKVVTMFNQQNPYTLVTQIGKYKINEYVSSYCYKKIEDVYNLVQKYNSSGQKVYECVCIDGLKTGICIKWMSNEYKYGKKRNHEQKCDEGYYVNGKKHGEWLCYVDYCGGTNYVGYEIQYHNGVAWNSCLQ